MYRWCGGRKVWNCGLKRPEIPEVDLWGARRRAKMFEREFNTSLAIEWRENAAATNGKPVAASKSEAEPVR